VHHDSQPAPANLHDGGAGVLVAVVSLLGHRSGTEEILKQLSAVIEALEPMDSAKAEQAEAQFEQQADRYDKEKDELQPEAKKLEQEVQAEQRRGDRFDSGEALLEIALVIASITLLTKRRLFWQQGLILGALGVLNAISAWIYENSDHGGRASPPVQSRSDDASPLRFS
jgi:hypothetical protein